MSSFVHSQLGFHSELETSLALIITIIRLRVSGNCPDDRVLADLVYDFRGGGGEEEPLLNGERFPFIEIMSDLLPRFFLFTLGEGGGGGGKFSSPTLENLISSPIDNELLGSVSYKVASCGRKEVKEEEEEEGVGQIGLLVLVALFGRIGDKDCG